MASELVGISAPTIEDLKCVDKSMTRNMEERPEDARAMMVTFSNFVDYLTANKVFTHDTGTNLTTAMSIGFMLALTMQKRDELEALSEPLRTNFGCKTTGAEPAQQTQGAVSPQPDICERLETWVRLRADSRLDFDFLELMRDAINAVQTERTMHNAWRKRAEEAELALAASSSESPQPSGEIEWCKCIAPIQAWRLGAFRCDRCLLPLRKITLTAEAAPPAQTPAPPSQIDEEIEVIPCPIHHKRDSYIVIRFGDRFRFQEWPKGDRKCCVGKAEAEAKAESLRKKGE